jgi:DNA-binding IclR family transcriptional regulator
MRDLRDETRETVQLGVCTGSEGVIVEKVEGLHALRIAVDLGLRFKLYNNAPGKVLLAFQPPGDRERLLSQLELTPHTSRTITDLGELRRECQRVIEQGYATDWAEADEGVHCVAAPILGRHQELAATIWVSAPSRRMPRETFAAVARQAICAAEIISRRIQE